MSFNLVNNLYDRGMQFLNAAVGNTESARDHERNVLMRKLEDFIDRSAQQNGNGELSSNRVNFFMSAYGVVSLEDEKALRERAVEKGIAYYHRAEQNYGVSGYTDTYSIKSHVIGDAFGRQMT